MRLKVGLAGGTGIVCKMVDCESVQETPTSVGACRMYNTAGAGSELDEVMASVDPVSSSVEPPAGVATLLCASYHRKLTTEMVEALMTSELAPV